MATKTKKKVSSSKVKTKKSTPKKAKTTRTVISVILDESGSMATQTSSIISLFNEYKNGLSSKATKKNPISLSLTTFNSEIRHVFDLKDIAEVPNLTTESYKPNLCTALYDAIGQTIRRIEQDPSNTEDTNYLVAIITDGEENMSREFTFEQIKSIIEEHEKKGWTFAYLAANQDAWATGTSLGISNNYNYQASAAGVRQMSQVMFSATLNYVNADSSLRRQGGVKGLFKDDDQQQQ